MSDAWIPVTLLAATAIAAITDTRSGLIPNWLTLPVALGAVVGHGIGSGIAAAAFALAAAIGCAFVPALLFRASAMGGGDVKLLAAIGALLGLHAGLEVQLTSYLLATVFALVGLAIRGELLATLGRALKLLTAPFSRKHARIDLSPSSLHEVRLGLPMFFAATSWFLASLLEAQL